MKKYSSAVEDYLQNVTYKSWTWERMTEDEQRRFKALRECGVFDQIKGNDATRMQWLCTIYTAFLQGLGYDSPNWRERAEDNI